MITKEVISRNVSLGLCRCEDRDWISIQKRLRGPLMSPYEDSFVDVKFSAGVFGSVTVNLDEGIFLHLCLLYTNLAMLIWKKRYGKVGDTYF